MTVATDISVAAPAWEQLAGLDALTQRAVEQCLATTGATLAPECELSVVFCDDALIRALNAQWRGVDRPTNALAFPTPGDLAAKPALGDIVIAYETLEREARQQDKTITAHLTHLLIHAFLHLIGYDHETAPRAEAMEAIERRVMAALGRPDPYEGTQPIGDDADPNGRIDANAHEA
ncbi:MAG: rRNA maturation RNase YbeY [Methylocystis sp.]|nr:rRNA maturation RNase YbeY [Methylocystis sp.]MBI3274611.1 rRNA maturation RNase YbeY [Methylocystis sp.]